VIIWDNKKQNWDNYDNSNYGWWETPLLNPTDWKGKWIQRYYLPGSIPDPNVSCSWYTYDPVPLFLKDFSLTKFSFINRARLYISALGYYEAFINGKKVGNNVLDPGFTTYNQTVLYTTYDILDIISANNTIGVMLGNGWYNPLPMIMYGQNLRNTFSTGFPATFRAQLTFDFYDGSSYTVATDNTWKVGAAPILFNNIFLGEVYDARLELPGWAEWGFDSSTWPLAVYSSVNANWSRSTHRLSGYLGRFMLWPVGL
jgi:alpha-L-rhamnosidase